jgi:hypothetical protein
MLTTRHPLSAKVGTNVIITKADNILFDFLSMNSTLNGISMISEVTPLIE